MSEFIQIQWTAGSIDEARKVSRYLVQEGLVACAQMIPWIESVYMWNGQLETEQESKVILKTRKENYDRIRTIIEQNCKYEVPEITYTYIDGGNQTYLDWLRDGSTGFELARR
jgi:periplasmic divalent cation tolerance protein